MSVAPNQLLMYDSAVSQWVLDKFSFCIPNKTFNLMVGTPDRAFAEYVTPTTTTPRDGKPPLPRAALTIEDPERDPQRFNSNTIRKLGYVDPATRLELRRANYPLSIRLPYTLNFWTEYYREMNLFEQQLMQLFRFNYLNLRVDLDSISPAAVYGQKDIELYLDGDIANSGDLEPGQVERIYRRTVNIHLNAWLWDYAFDKAYTLREVEVEFWDSSRDPNLLLEVVSTPKRETLISGVDGTTLIFGPVDTARIPIIANTFLVDAMVGGNNIRGRDDGSGSIIDPINSGVTGTVDYVGGEVNLTYSSPPDAGTDITAAYFTSED